MIIPQSCALVCGGCGVFHGFRGLTRIWESLVVGDGCELDHGTQAVTWSSYGERPRLLSLAIVFGYLDPQNDPGAGEMPTSPFEWTIAASGVITAAAGLTALLAPRPLLRLAFAVEGAPSSTVFLVRHWGVLLFVVGVLIVYSVGVPEIRTPVLLAAAVEKIAIGLLLFLGSMKRTSVMTAVALGDAVFAILYVTYVVWR